MNLNSRLPKILESRGIKQNWLSDKSGITPQTLSNCLAEKHNVSLVVALKVAKALELKIEDIWSLPE